MVEKKLILKLLEQEEERIKFMDQDVYEDSVINDKKLQFNSFFAKEKISITIEITENE